MASVPQLHAALYHNILVRVTHSVVNSLLLGYESFELLNKIFDKFAGLWMSMKIQTKAKEAEGARNYKFKTRQFKIEDILEVDVSTLGHSFSDGTLCEEWQEMTTEEESTEWVAPKENEDLEEEWGLIDESILNSMVHIHNQFFGSCSLADSPGFNQISDVDKLSSFRESYKLGWTMVKVLPALLSSSLDAKLVSEHLLHLSLDYEEKFENFHQPKCAYNVYKDSNPPVIAKMVDPLIDLQQRVLSLLNEWPDHPDLQKMLDVTKMILAIPFSTPLPKVLSGLQFLLTKSHELDENAPKLSLSDKMRPILTLVSTWQKLELESWPALLDGVQEQYEINSGKLWFPLYTVLYRGPTADMAADNQSTIQSLEEFIQTSSVGEFKRRLQLLLAFHGQMSICLKFNKCPSLTQNNENLDQQMKYIGNIEKILYNLFGYYIQFMPLVSEHIAAIKRSISADIKELMKLHRWERPDNYLSIEISKRTRQKLKKHIQKFNDVLQQPMMVILSKEIAKVGITVESVLKQEVSTDNLYKCSLSSPISIDMKLFTGTERSIWHTDWRKKVDFSLEYWSHLKLSDFNLQYISLKDAEENDSFIKQSLISQSGCWEEWKPLWNSLENVCRTITECDDIWDVEKKNFGKRRALSDLLKLLESCGLSRRKSMIAEEGFGTNHQNSWFLQPSYHVKHLLPPNGDDVTSYNQIEFPLGKRFDSTWKTANQYHYGSLAMVQLLRQTCLNFHKDISLDQVTKAASFVDHLIVIQQEQRSFAYKFTGDVENLRNCVNSLNDLDMNYSINGDATTIESFVALKQHATRTSMWSQKTLLDNLYCISQETTLFLRKVESTHLNSCQSVKVAANKLLAFFGKFIPTLRKSKDSLDQYLLKGSRSLATPEAFSSPFLVSKQMEQLVIQNFQEINELEEHVQAFSQQDVTKRSVEESLVQRLGDVLHKGKVRMQETCYAVEPKNHAINSSDANASSNSSSDPEAEFANSFSRTLDLIIKTFQKLGSSTSELDHSEDTLTAKITQWKVLVQSDQMNLQLDLICQELSQTITTAGQLIDCAGDRIPNLCYEIQLYLNYLCALVHPILAMADGFLLEFLTIHRTVAEMTYILAKVFASLFSKGFGGSSEDPTDDTNGDASQAASGTGMGEGAGVKDVSDQIEDEDQLLGTSEKPTDELETPNEPPSKNEKGVEMDQDFAADTFSVSEDSGEEDNDDNEDNEDQKLDSAMGNTGDDNEVVDEKLWDKDDEGNPDTKNEKNESGPSVKDMDNNSRELQAKGDDDNTLDESAEPNADKPDKDNPNDDDQDGDDHDESLDDVKLDKESAVTDPTGIEMDDQNQAPEEDTNMEEAEVSDAMEPEGTDAMEEVETEDLDETDKNENDGDGMTDELDEETEKVKSGEVDGNAETDDPEKDHDEAAADLDLLSPTKNEIEQGDTNFAGNTVPLANSGMQLNAEAPTTEMSAMEPMEHRSSNENMQNGLAPSMGLPSGNSVDAKLTMPDSIKGGELTADEQKAQSPQLDNSSVERTQPNPYRSVGDALEKWKERVKVSTDAEEHKAEVPDEVDDDNADEYGFVPELEKGTSQALGPATSDQIDRNIKGSDADGEEGLTEKKEDLTEMEVQKQEPEIFTSKNHSALMQKLNEQMHNSDLNTETPPDEALEEGFDEDDSSIMSRDIVTLKKSYMEEEILQFARLAVDEEDLGKAMNLEMSTVVEGDPAALWRKYEQITARLSQELAEQLRLVMEPTLASKLQGDYKTGKRINMKKVIAYIASYYRKDKIWLRRTRPNKRDYQVVVAVDDSRSMSESHCEGVAIEALVTVCRAMSQLEVGKLAVASFGKKGNIRLLHDFDQQFTGEAGMKMISSLTFKQENTILDEPVVDLLQYLNNLLDVAAATSRLPSGQSPLQQLVLIIGDGRFHEKERLKRRVRDLLNKNRMVAFLLLDSPQDSIIKCQEVSMQGGQPILSRYLDSFPFPYYIVLKNIEALPRTLADLLRQWFELMQNTRD